MPAERSRLPGNRLHLNHGPIDLVIGAYGTPDQVERAYAAAWAAFPAILPGLVQELAILRAPITPGNHAPPPFGLPAMLVEGPVARRMVAAVWPYRRVFVTPMAAVAGAVAEEVLAAMVAAADLERAYVNNGGDIAIHLAPETEFAIGVVADLTAPAIDARVTIRATDPVRGIATSGWRGRSLSLGIADAVSVLARTAAEADAAATMIANAVDVPHAAIRRAPARAVRDDSDLHDLLVTTDVGLLPAQARRAALDAGLRRAAELIEADLAIAAFLVLQGEQRSVGHAPGR